MVYSLQQNNLGITAQMAVTDVSGQPVGPIFKPRTVQGDCLTPDYETDRLSPNVGNYRQSELRNVPEERRSNLHCGGILKSRAKVC